MVLSFIKTPEQLAMSSPEFGTVLSLLGMSVLWMGPPRIGFVKFYDAISDLYFTKPHSGLIVIIVGANVLKNILHN